MSSAKRGLVIVLPFFNDCTAASTPLRRRGWLSSVSVRGQFSSWWIPIGLVTVLLGEQYSVHRLSISRSSVMHFPERSWMVAAFLYFTVFWSFTSWYALLPFFFFRFSSISLHCSSIQFSFAFFMHFLVLLFTSLCVWQILQVRIFSFSILFLLHRSHRSRHSASSKASFGYLGVWTTPW